jgi:hypothetical protein
MKTHSFSGRSVNRTFPTRSSDSSKANSQRGSRKSMDHSKARSPNGIHPNSSATSPTKTALRFALSGTLRTQFLLETQTAFCEQSIAFLRKLGFEGLICASNWSTASPEVLGPLEKLSYSVGDFIDRHGYFGVVHKGENSEWSIRNGHTYADRSALRFENSEPGKPRLFVHPAMDPHYANKPSMISETTWTRPNRYRSEAPLYYAAYGALQDSDAIVHFAHDGADWKVKPNFWMQPWTLTSPAMMGQFPAAALIYRQGLMDPGAVVAKITLNTNDLRALKGTPLPQDAALDELRLKDIPAVHEAKAGQRLDPLLHYVGRTEVAFTASPATSTASLGNGRIDHAAKKITSSHGQLELDYEHGLFRLNAPKAQGAVGNLKTGQRIDLAEMSIESELDLGAIVLVSLDAEPIRTASKMLLQVMSEEQNSGWQTETIEGGKKRITSIGQDPWTIKPIAGQIRLKRADASTLSVTALDPNGAVVLKLANASDISLRPDTIYYIIEKRGER